ncbi:patatin-like phospholipase family protein [Pinisolibacter sp.]|mgnify:CR=1 FL=1|uniref:patatin-like phospholipase family protein n=1 Tax=Pinisolibacter sp. TaxID=2172024 RepID=UPI002FDEB647
MLEGVTRRIFGANAVGHDEIGVRERLRRPKVGLALGGGAARGWAAIGVVRRLHEAGIVPDVVAGTSMGAVVGACDLAGRLGCLETFALELTPRRVLSLLDLRFGGSGLIDGSRLANLLTERLGDIRVEDLKRPFTAVATELATGHEIWMNSGRLIEALRASYALPGVFEPVRVAGRILVDGALVNPVPVSVCRALGAELVIAVNLSTDTFAHGTVVQTLRAEAAANDTRHEGLADRVGRGLFRRFFDGDDGRPGLTGVMMESFNIIQDRITRSRLAGDPPDVTIAPRLGHIGLFDFHRADEAIDIGATATDRAVADIRSLVAEMTR